jgi:hypothetical protein
MTVRFTTILLLLTLGVVTAQTNSVPARKDNLMYAELAKAPQKAPARRNPLEHYLDAIAARRKTLCSALCRVPRRNGGGWPEAPSLLAEQVQQATLGTLFWTLTNGIVRHGMPVCSSCRNRNAGRLSAISNRSLPLESLHSDRGEYSQVVKYPKALTTPESSGHLVCCRQY